MVPQKQMRNMPIIIPEPPAFAATAPDNARKTIAKPYNKITIICTGAKSDTKKGKIPPDIKDAPEARAA